MKNRIFIFVFLSIVVYFLFFHELTCSNVSKNKNELISLSKYCNYLAKKVGQLSCQISDKKVSLNGGWCSKISGKNSSFHATDIDVARNMSNFLKHKNVASFGDGPGIYKEIFETLGDVKKYDAFDGAPFCEEATKGKVNFLDLTIPIYHLESYDWIISLEVAEHIQKKFEEIYIDNLIRYSREGIIISWATPGQGGLSHINEKSFEEVKKIFENKNYYHMASESMVLRNSAKLPWLKKNLNIFKKTK